MAKVQQRIAQSRKSGSPGLSLQSEAPAQFNGFIDPDGKEINVAKIPGAMRDAANEIVMKKKFTLVSPDPVEALIANQYAVIRDGRSDIGSLQKTTPQALATIKGKIASRHVSNGKSTSEFFAARSTTPNASGATILTAGVSG